MLSLMHEKEGMAGRRMDVVSELTHVILLRRGDSGQHGLGKGDRRGGLHTRGSIGSWGNFLCRQIGNGEAGSRVEFNARDRLQMHMLEDRI